MTDWDNVHEPPRGLHPPSVCKHGAAPSATNLGSAPNAQRRPNTEVSALPLLEPGHAPAGFLGTGMDVEQVSELGQEVCLLCWGHEDRSYPYPFLGAAEQVTPCWTACTAENNSLRCWRPAARIEPGTLQGRVRTASCSSWWLPVSLGWWSRPPNFCLSGHVALALLLEGHLSSG